MLEYKIVEKSQFTVMGKSRKINTETAYSEIPMFWQEHMKSGGAKLCAACMEYVWTMMAKAWITLLLIIIFPGMRFRMAMKPK